MPDCFNVRLSLVSVQYLDVLNFINLKSYSPCPTGTDVYLILYALIIRHNDNIAISSHLHYRLRILILILIKTILDFGMIPPRCATVRARGPPEWLPFAFQKVANGRL